MEIGRVGSEIVSEAKEAGFTRCNIRGIVFSLPDARAYISEHYKTDRFTIDIQGDVFRLKEGSNTYNPDDVVFRFR